MYNPTININWKKVILVIVILFLVLAILFVVYNKFFIPAEDEQSLIDLEIKKQVDELEEIRIDRRGEDYVAPTEEERDEDIERQIEDLQELRRIKAVEEEDAD